MNVFTKSILVIACFFAAIACYSFGVPAGGIVFFIGGLVFEGLFWTGIFKRKKNPTWS